MTPSTAQMLWHVVRDVHPLEKADDAKYDDSEDVWTISPDPDRTGWQNDCNQPGYGLPKDVAEWIANTLNASGGVPKWMQNKYRLEQIWDLKNH